MLNARQALKLFSRYYPDALDPEDLLDLVALRGVASTPWRHLSGGEQQRLALALALIGKPEVVFLDEPTAGVDPEGRVAIRAVIGDLRARGACVLITTHELSEAERMADRIVIVAAGRIVLEGTVSALTDRTAADGLSFGAPAGLDTSSLGAALGRSADVTETAPGRYRVRGASGPAATAALANWLAERQAGLHDLSSGRSLEDVYFDAVGAAAAALPTEADGPTPSRRRRPGRRQ
jgi:ABC-2 type transport system ATP-binding protein